MVNYPALRPNLAAHKLSGKVDSFKLTINRMSDLDANALKRELPLRAGKRTSHARRSAEQELPAAPVLLHSAFAAERLMLWGETGGVVSKEREDPTHATHGEQRFPPSPYSAKGEVLLAAIHASGVPLGNRRTQGVAIQLPSLKDRPHASSPLVAQSPANAEKLVLRPWLVTAVDLQWPAAIDFLCACAGKRTPAAGVVVADDLAYWVAALRLAGAMVARQHFLPDIVERGGKFVARWRPVPSHAEARALADLAASMPDVCRAVSDGGMTPHAPTDLLLSFVESVLNEMVRSTPARELIGPAHASFESLDEQWLAALIQPDPTLKGNRAALAQLRDRVRDWWRPVALHASSPFRLCFRLEEPETPAPDAKRSDHRLAVPEGSWRVSYFLQARRDPSLLLPAGEAWSTSGHAAKLFRQQSGFNAQEYLLQSLGEAARLCPPVEESLRGAMPDGVEIDAAAAVRFVTEYASFLDQAGFGVMLPAGWTSRGPRLRLQVRAKVKSPAMAGGGGLSMQQIVEVDFDAALGGQAITREELRALAKLKVPLVRARGQWVLLDAQEIARTVALLGSGTRSMTAQAAVRMALDATIVDGVQVSSVGADGWFSTLLERLSGEGRIENLPVPSSFVGRLRPYQERGFHWLGFLARWGLGACLADDMGLGKTVQTLVHIAREREEVPGKPPVLLICPTSVISNWQHEAARFTPALSVLVHHGTARAKEEAAFLDIAGAQDLVITSYSLLHRDFATLARLAWSGVILDEAQNIKNPESKQSRSARSLQGDYRIALTGTPVENNVGDLWSLMEFLNPGLLGSQAEFKRKFFVPIQASRDPAAAEHLKKLTAPFILRRLKTDKTVIADLPDKLEMKVYCTLTREQASLYAAVIEEAMPKLDSASGIQRKGMVLAMLSKLKQICNHPAQFLKDNSAIPDRSGKLARLVEMLEEVLEGGERALVFSQFAEMGAILKRHLEVTFGREVLFLHGAVPKARRDAMVARFQKEDDAGPPIFLLSLKAGGTGLNLTAASRVFHFDRWWNPAVEQQATDRAFRIGQHRNVFVHKFLCSGTLEEKIDAMIERKRSVAQTIIGAGEDWVTKLSTTELRELFALQPDAVADQ
jgi:superfamily II DNA or RNA helicase